MFTFIESASFARWLPEYLSDGGYARLQNFLLIHPLAGALVPGSGGVRKLRWKLSGQGKRGGVRVIYYVRYAPNEVWLLTIYAKARQEDAPAHILRRLKEAFANE